jgi:L-asparaginase
VSALPQVLIASLGGTIAMTRSSDGAGVSPSLDGAELTSVVPDLARFARIQTKSVLRIPGAHLTIDDVLQLAARLRSKDFASHDGFVITQGTDTIEETAFLLDLVTTDERPLVVTGAMRNPTVAGADGPANLLAAVQVAADPKARGLGTLVVFNDEIHAAAYVQKSNTTSPAAFASVTGPLGWTSEGRPRILTVPRRRLHVSPTNLGPSRPVALVTTALDDDGRSLRHLAEDGFEGAVIEALGGGHVTTAVAAGLEQLASQMPVLMASRTGRGDVLRDTYDFPGSELDLRERGVLPAGWLDGPKTRVLLAMLLRAGLDRDAINRYVTDHLLDETA